MNALNNALRTDLKIILYEYITKRSLNSLLRHLFPHCFIKTLKKFLSINALEEIL